VIEREDYTEITNSLNPFSLFNTSLEMMPLFAIKRFWPMRHNLHIANASCRLKLSQLILFGPREETTECSQPPVDRRWSRRWVLFLEKLAVGTNICRGDLIDAKFADRLGVPGDKMGEVRKIGVCCVPAGIFGMKILLECFKDLWKINSIGYHGISSFCEKK
jgi:hypothetical protein